MKSTSYDPDGEIKDIRWSVTPATGMVGSLAGAENTVYFDAEGDYTITLRVEDQWGLTDTATATVHVKPAIPTAFFRYTGTPKQNRKVVFDSSESYGSTRYPVDFSQNQWELIPPPGVPAEAVRVVAWPDLKTWTVTFKQPGDYRVRLAVKNTKGKVSPWFEETVTIAPDQPPVADFYTTSTVRRDPENGNRAAITLVDRSYSPDGDVIASRVWKYRYDSNNDGSFADESWVTLDSGNNACPTLYASQVGRYQFDLTVTEQSGQETVPEFSEPGDLRTANTDTKPLAAKTVEVINIQPVVNFDVIRKKKVDIAVTMNEADYSKTGGRNLERRKIVPAVIAKGLKRFHVPDVFCEASGTQKEALGRPLGEP